MRDEPAVATGRIVRHLLLPLILPLAFLAVAATPVDVLGCRNRGLLALLIALAGGLGGVATAAIAVAGKVRRRPDSEWWVASALILAVPAVALLFLA